MKLLNAMTINFLSLATMSALVVIFHIIFSQLLPDVVLGAAYFLLGYLWQLLWPFFGSVKNES